MGIFSRVIERSKGVKFYSETLDDFLEKRSLSEEQKIKLDEIKNEYKLDDKVVYSAKISAFNKVWNNIISDLTISDDEHKEIERVGTDLEIKLEDTQFDQEDFNKYRALGMIQSGKLPNMDKSICDSFGLILKPDEQLYYGQAGVLRKLTTRTTVSRINYSGLTASIRIMKGVRYRIGSVKPGMQKVTQEVLAIDDKGLLYLTNIGIGFAGAKKRFVIRYEQLASVQLTENGLTIFKSGKETPYIITMNDYEVILAIISFKLNEEEK